MARPINFAFCCSTRVLGVTCCDLCVAWTCCVNLDCVVLFHSRFQRIYKLVIRTHKLRETAGSTKLMHRRTRFVFKFFHMFFSTQATNSRLPEFFDDGFCNITCHLFLNSYEKNTFRIKTRGLS